MRVANLEVDQYLLREQILDAGMDVVWRADQRAFARQVADHVGPHDLETLPQVLRRVRRTTRVAAIDVDAASPPLVVMTRVEGTTLASELWAGTPFPVGRALDLTIQILRAVAVAHAAGVVHADLRPEHVVITLQPDGRELVTVVDRGDPHEREWVPAASYLAPEILAGSQPSVASDLYAVGVMLYELLTGEPPFQGGTILDVLHRQLHGAVVAPSLHHADRHIPAHVDRVALRALARIPTGRFPDAAMFAAELESARRSVARGTTPPPQQAQPAPAPMPAVVKPPAATVIITPPRSRPASASPDGLEAQLARLRGAVAAAIDNGAAGPIVDRSLDLALALSRHDRHADAHKALEAAKEYVMWDDRLDDRDVPRLFQRIERAQARLRDRETVTR